MNEDEQKSKERSNWWQPGVLLFSEVSAWIAAPIILALVVGKSLDNHLGTKPLMLLLLAGVGFLITAFGIVRTVKKYMIKINKK